MNLHVAFLELCSQTLHVIKSTLQDYEGHNVDELLQGGHHALSSGLCLSVPIPDLLLHSWVVIRLAHCTQANNDEFVELKKRLEASATLNPSGFAQPFEFLMPCIWSVLCALIRSVHHDTVW